MGLSVTRYSLSEWVSSAFELNRGKKSNYSGMEGVRGFAVLLVFFVHFNSLIAPWMLPEISTGLLFLSLTELGHSGVDIFFALSGFLIYGSVLKSKDFGTIAYARQRSVRLYPAFAVVFLLYLLLYVLGFAEGKAIPSNSTDQVLYFISNLLFMPLVFGFDYFITVSWSLTYEIGFYILAPVLILTLNFQGKSFLFRLLSLILIATVMFAYFSNYPGPERVLMFVCGAIVYEIVKKEKGWTLPRHLGFLALLVSSSAIAWHNPLGMPLMVMMFTMFICIGVFLIEVINGDSRWLRWLTWAPIRYLGNMSYSYYLIHGLFIHFSMRCLSQFIEPSLNMTWGYFPVMALTLSITILGSATLFLLVEKRYSL